MPVLVTRADVGAGPRLVATLLSRGGQVRAHCTGRGNVQALRQLGAVTAIADADDAGHIEAALTRVHTLVHVGVDPTLPAYEDTSIATAASIGAAERAGVQRLIYVSLNCDPAASTPLADEVRTGEELAAGAAMETIIVRTPLLLTAEVAEVLSRAEGSGAHLLPVTTPAALAEIVASIDDERTAVSDGTAYLHVSSTSPRAVAPLAEAPSVSPRLIDLQQVISSDTPDWMPEAREFLSMSPASA